MIKKCFILLLILFNFAYPCFAEIVVFNTNTHKVHKINCRWAHKCTVNCIKIDRKEAYKRGGIPCHKCGG